MCNAKNVNLFETFFEGDTLLQEYLCPENHVVKFFDIEELPQIKEKQRLLIKKVLSVLKETKIKTKDNLLLS
jgi:hypothetical protein